MPGLLLKVFRKLCILSENKTVSFVCFKSISGLPSSRSILNDLDDESATFSKISTIKLYRKRNKVQA